jgi:hypothetical protein
MIAPILAITMGDLATKVAPMYLAVEVVFYVVFHQYFVPRANRLVPPAPFRDYGKERARLMIRILRRMEATCALSNNDVQSTIHRFLAEWFHVSRNFKHSNVNDETITNFPGMSVTPTSSAENSDDDTDSQPSSRSAVPVSPTTASPLDSKASVEPSICLYREDINDFFAWAFFGKHYLNLLQWEMQELSKIFSLLKEEQNIQFPFRPTCPEKRMSEAYHDTQPRCMTLEPVNALHRPLLVYVIVLFAKIVAGFLLRLLGYRRLVASTGLVGWYKAGKLPATQPKPTSLLPMLFFHGIAPCGFVLYLPMILFGIATEPERPIFIFENRSISCTIDFLPLTEDQTVQGIQEIVDQCLGKEQTFSVMGHSFGSCPIAWLLKSTIADRIQQITLLDPVAILLSEPDVMVNFLYAREINRIRMVASSELFTEFYLRRHFAWYNSELWLQDMHKHHKMLVCLSEQDEILNAKKVKQELERHASETPHSKPVTVYWTNVGHGACISSPNKWRQVKKIMLEQELEIVQQKG